MVKKNNSWIEWVAVIALVVAIVAVVLVLKANYITEPSLSPRPCVKNSADLNRDGFVKSDDQSILQAKLGSRGCKKLTWCNCADINQDKIVSGADQSILLQQWCKDTDINLGNLNVKGVISWYEKDVKVTESDICGDKPGLVNENVLHEGFCDAGGNPIFAEFNCRNYGLVCRDGACVNA